MVMKDTRQTQAIGLGGIRVKDDTSVLQMLVGQKFPLNLANGSGTRCSFGRHHREQSLQQQRIWATTLNKATPLFPHHSLFGILSKVLEICARECGLVCFDIRPTLAIAEDNEFLLFLNPGLSQTHQAFLHILDGFVVDVEDAMDSRIGDSIE